MAVKKNQPQHQTPQHQLHNNNNHHHSQASPNSSRELGLTTKPINLEAILVHKYFFTTLDREQRLLVKCGLTFLTADGRLLDLDIWGRNEHTKAHYLYRKLKTGYVHTLLKCSRFNSTNANYTSSEWRISNHRELWIQEVEDEKRQKAFSPANYMPCTTSCTEAKRIMETGVAVNIMATYIARHRGPCKFLPGMDSPIAVGHLVEFEDKNLVRFYVLLWQPRNIRAPYDLYGWDRGAIVLIPNCRASTRPPAASRFTQDPEALHFTTLCHAVSNSHAVSEDKFKDFSMKRPSGQPKTNGDSQSIQLNNHAKKTQPSRRNKSRT